MKMNYSKPEIEIIESQLINVLAASIVDGEIGVIDEEIGGSDAPRWRKAF